MVSSVNAALEAFFYRTRRTIPVCDVLELAPLACVVHAALTTQPSNPVPILELHPR